MVFCHISSDIKERALWLLAHDYIPDDVAEIFDVSQWSLQHWKKNVFVHGSVVPLKNPFQGHSCILNSIQTDALLSTIDKWPDMFPDEIQDWIAVSFDVSISIPLLHSIIWDSAFTYKML